jgi:hypothetical protein
VSEENVLTFDLKPFENWCGMFPKETYNALLQIIALNLDNVRSIARMTHRFQSTPGRRPTGRYYRNTGALEDSIRVKMESDGGRVYLEEGIAPYGKFVHDGQRTWEPDQFVYDAFETQKDNIVSDLNYALDEAIRGI